MCANLAKICHFHAEMVTFELILTHLKYFWVNGGGGQYLGEYPNAPCGAATGRIKRLRVTQFFHKKIGGHKFSENFFSDTAKNYDFFPTMRL